MFSKVGSYICQVHAVTKVACNCNASSRDRTLPPSPATIFCVMINFTGLGLQFQENVFAQLIKPVTCLQVWPPATVPGAADDAGGEGGRWGVAPHQQL